MKSPINWQQFGLKNNPYDTLPLVEGGDISIKDAFVGRVKEREFIDNIFNADNRGCLVICGETGVGKTSLANFQKFIWKYTTPKLLFSFRREIEACDEILNKKSFVIEILGSVVREISFLDPKLLKEDLLIKIQSLLDVSQTLSISGGVSGSVYGFGGGLDFGKDRNIAQPLQISTAVLEGYFNSLVEFIKKNPIGDLNYSGLIVHINNFDVVLARESDSDKVKKFFNEIRDILQTKDTFFIFLGPKNFFKDIISPQQRVKSVFLQTPLTLNPLSKTEVIEAFEQRMKLLKSESVANYIKPIEDEVIFRLYDLYDGDLRSIMSAVRDILGNYSEKIINQPLSVNEAMILLGKERMEKIEHTSSLTKEQKQVLKFLVQTGKNISQTEASKILKKPSSNISGYYFKPLKEMGIIEEKERNGKLVFWGLTTQYEPLRWVYESQEKVESEIREIVRQQPTLFDGLFTHDKSK